MKLLSLEKGDQMGRESLREFRRMSLKRGPGAIDLKRAPQSKKMEGGLIPPGRVGAFEHEDARADRFCAMKNALENVLRGGVASSLNASEGSALHIKNEKAIRLVTAK